MNNSILITGADGFIGSHLQRSMSLAGKEVKVFSGNISSYQNVDEQIRDCEPGVIFHLAGLSNVGDCENDPQKAFSVNVQGTFNILESIKRGTRRVRLIFPSTGYVYETHSQPENEVFIDENYPTNPISIYAKTKLYSEIIIKQYFEHNDMGEAFVFRLFNHTHSSQKGPFFFPQLYRQLLDRKMGILSGDIKTGNLDLYRDFSLLNDLLTLLMKASDKNINTSFSLFNVCSNRPRKLGDLAKHLANALGLEVNFITDPSKIRKDDPKLLIGSNDKACSTFDWSPSDLSDEEFIHSFLSSDVH